MSLRGILRGFGLKVGKTSQRTFASRVPSQPHQLCDPAGILAVSLHRHRLERIADVSGLQQFYRKPSLAHRRIQPLRQRTGLQPDPRHRKANLAEPGDQCRWLAGNLRPRTIRPDASTTHTLELSSDTSVPA